MSNHKIKVLWHWLTMGPYHFARMMELGRQDNVDLTVIETTSRDDHGWVRANGLFPFHLTTLTSRLRSDQVLQETAPQFINELNRLHPDVVVASGYGERHSRDAVCQYRKKNTNTKLLLWSESTAADRKRNWFTEKLKSRLLRNFDGALVAGTRHREYLVRLGMPESNIAIVGNSVDNSFFSEVHHERHSRFLYVGRFVPQKNLPFLLRAFKRYREMAASPWDLVLVGDGPQKSELEHLVSAENITGIHFAGLSQVEGVRDHYSTAKCFVLPSISEPWGLVVNEAMATGLPVLVSRSCGCATDLVREGENGFTFDPHNADELAHLLARVSEGTMDCEALGKQGQSMIEGFSPQAFAARAAAFISQSTQSPASQQSFSLAR